MAPKRKCSTSTVGRHTKKSTLPSHEGLNAIERFKGLDEQMSDNVESKATSDGDPSKPQATDIISHGFAKTKSAAFQTRCSPRRFKEKISKLNHAQLAAINKMGFGPLLDLDCYVLNRVLCLKLVKSFDLQDHTLCIKGSRIPIGFRDVGLVLGLPSSSRPVNTGVSKDQLAKVKDFSGITVVGLEQILASRESGIKFRRAFLLFALCVLLCPTTKNSLTSTLLPAIIDIDNAIEYNWCKFVFDWLVKEIAKYKKACLPTASHKEKKSIGGCMFFLMVIYFHKRQLGSVTVVAEPPLIKVWNTDRIQIRVREETKNEQGLLYHLEESDDPTWLHDMFKHEVTRFLYKQMVEKLLKPLDAMLMSGQFNLRPEDIGNIPSPSDYVEEVSRQAACKDAARPDEDLKRPSDGDGKEGIDITTARPTRQPKKAPSMRSPFVSGQMDKEAVQLNKLYNFCIRKPSHQRPGTEILVNMFDQYLNREDTYTMRPNGWVNSMVFMLAPMVFMEEEKERTQRITRHMFSYLFIEHVKGELDQYKQQQHKPWSSRTTRNFIGSEQLGYDMSQCKLIFAPAVYENHWFCYALDTTEKKLFVLDSLEKHEDGSEKAVLDSLTKLRFEELLVILNPTLKKNPPSLELVHVDLPRQRNCNDCGVYVLKYMEIWDGVKKWDNHTMPNYSLDDICNIRRDLLCRWVLHPKNEAKEQVLCDAKIVGLM